MTDVIAGQPVTLLSQWYDFEGGSLTDLDATPTTPPVRPTNGPYRGRSLHPGSPETTMMQHHQRGHCVR